MSTKEVLEVYKSPAGHWVGDGFPVRSLLSVQRQGPKISPFLLLDHAGPAEFDPADEPRGVREHPHRGFETVTLIYAGEVEHRDSAGHSGSIGPGDVQWMTAGSGVVHEELHSRRFTKEGGVLEMVQLWVNLPAKDKMTKPRYQDILDADIPRVPLEGDAGFLRVIAGDFQGTRGPAHTFTPLDVFDLELSGGKSAHLSRPAGHSTVLVVLHGAVTAGGGQSVDQGEVALTSLEGENLTITANENARLLLLGGEPIDEPIEQHGPFVMNSREEILQAITDFQGGRMGRL